MIDYYNDYMGPNKNEAINILTFNIKKYKSIEKKYNIFHTFTYLNEEILDYIIKNNVEEHFTDKSIKSSIIWTTVIYQKIYNNIFKNLHNVNNNLKKKHKQKICATLIILNNILSNDILLKLKNILLKE